MAKVKPFNFLEEANEELKSCLKNEGRTVAYGTSKILIKEGNISNQVIILLNGEVSINTTDYQGNPQCLATLSDGDMVGEMSWLEKRPAVADVVTTTDSTVLELDFVVLDQLRQKQPTMAAAWQRLVAQKLARQIQSQNAWIHRYEGPGEEIEPIRKVLVLFSELDDRDINLLGEIGSLRRVQPGDILLQQGHPVPSMFLILAGDAQIYVEINGDNKQVGSSRRGELLGELTLLTSEAQGASATVESLGGMELLELNKADLNQALQDDSNFAARFYRILS